MPLKDFFQQKINPQNFMRTIKGFGNREEYSAIEGQLKADWDASNISNEQFLERYKNPLQNIQIGCSLSVEELEWQANENGLATSFDPKQVVDFIHTQLGITDVRFGIRWENAVNKKGEIDLSKYEPYLRALMKKGINICLNVGPIKTFRYPEDHVPNNVLARVNKPHNGGEVTLNNPLAQEGLKYMQKLFDKIQTEYPDDLQLFTGIQIENEPFTHFGKHEWSMDHEYLLQAIGQIPPAFQHANVLINSPGVPTQGSKYKTSMGEAIDFATKLIARYPHFKGKTDVGLDYYYTTPDSRELRGIGMVEDMNVVIQKREGINAFETQKQIANKVGFNLQIAEAQCEPWEGSRWGNPGNSAREWRFTLIRSMRILDLNNPSLISLWGVEHLLLMQKMGQLTEEHRGIMKLTREINL